MALSMTGVFAFVLLKQWVVAVGFVVVCLLILAAWHGKEPQEA
jgi:hypothetical protein